MMLSNRFLDVLFVTRTCALARRRFDAKPEARVSDVNTAYESSCIPRGIVPKDRSWEQEMLRKYSLTPREYSVGKKLITRP